MAVLARAVEGVLFSRAITYAEAKVTFVESGKLVAHFTLEFAFSSQVTQDGMTAVGAAVTTRP